MSTPWGDLAMLGWSILGPLVGHRRATKVAANTSRVLLLARDAAYFVATTFKTEQAADAADIISTGSRRFENMLDAAGLKLTDAQEEQAIAEARHTLTQLGMASVGVAADRLTVASMQLSRELAKLRPTLARIGKEQAAAKAAWNRKHGGAK